MLRPNAMDEHSSLHVENVPTQGSVLDLPWLERTLLWSIRSWAAYHDAPHSILGYLECVFIDAGFRPALEPFTQMMATIFAGLKRCPDIRCVRCLRLGRDERALLEVLSEATQHETQCTAQRLQFLVLHSQAQQAALAAHELMRHINNVGLHLQRARPQRAASPNETCWPPSYQQLGERRH